MPNDCNRFPKTSQKVPRRRRMEVIASDYYKQSIGIPAVQTCGLKLRPSVGLRAANLNEELMIRRTRLSKQPAAQYSTCPLSSAVVYSYNHASRDGLTLAATSEGDLAKLQ